MFSCKKGEVSHAFKTLPGSEITRLELGGALGKYRDGQYKSDSTKQTQVNAGSTVRI